MAGCWLQTSACVACMVTLARDATATDSGALHQHAVSLFPDWLLVCCGHT